MKAIQKAWQILDRLIAVVTSLCLGGMTIIIFAQVIFRYILKSPLSWSEESARYLFVWVSFIGSVVAARQGQHIGVELLVKRFPGQIRRFVQILAHLATAGFFAVVLYAVIEMWPKLMSQTTSALKLPMGYPYLGLAIGCALMIVFYLTEALLQLVKPEEGGE